MKEQDNRRYPIGQFEYGGTYSLDDTRKHIKALDKFPKELKRTIKKLRGNDLDKPYRAGGWTIRQVVHHIADSHLNAYVRLKLAVTENTPIIKPYEEQLWAQTEDAQNGPVKMSLKLLAALHTRWVAFLESLSEEDLERGYYHPDAKRTVLVQEAIALYVWHSQHHLHHIRLIADGKSKGEEAALPTADALMIVDDESAPKKRGPKPKAKPELAANAEPKKRGMSEDHKAKIRAAHQARRIARGGEATPATPAPTEGRRTRRTKEQMAADRAAVPAVATERRKPGPKPKAAAAESATSAPTAAKRTRRTKEQMAIDRAAQATQTTGERRKPGRPAQPKAEKSANDAPKKRGMSPEHMAKIREARMAKRAEAISSGIITPKAKKEKATDENGAPKKRGMSPEHMAKIREARMSKRAAAADNGAATATTSTAKTAKPKKEKAAPATDDENGAPKKRGMSPEHMAKIREARMAKRALSADNGAESATTSTAKTAKPKKEKAAPATDENGAPKKRGMSPEHMAKIREARMAKRALSADSGAETASTTTKTAKPKKEKAAPATDENGAPKKRGMSPEHMAKIREARMTKRAESNATADITPKAKKEKAVATDENGAPKKRGMSPEHMAKIREARMAKIAAKKAQGN